MSRAPLTAAQVARELEATRSSLPIFAQLADLFTDPRTFASFNRFSSAGFSLVPHAQHKIMTGRHKRARGYVFKKYDDTVSEKKQLKNYMRRIEGARLLRSFIVERGLQRVVAPRKWLYELPDRFPQRYLLVADRFDLLSDDSTLRKYHRISEEQTHELATVLFYFRGLNSWTKNLPFTDDGRIAFIDTERWGRDKDYLRMIGDALPIERRDQAKSVYNELRAAGAQPFQTAFK